MEATREVEDLLDQVRPPRLEDAGLEDCALPPESIKEAFLKAATAVGSRAASIFTTSDDERNASEEEGRCTNDPWPNLGKSSDTPVGTNDGINPPPGGYAAEKGDDVPGVIGDELVVGVTDAEEKADKVMVGPDMPEGDGKACVDGLQGLKIGDGAEDGCENKSKNDEEDEEERESGRQIFAEAYYV
ncbi:hypothetical protein U1Q18_026966 [Sarracenia purpurea var. burkii]